MDNLGPTPDENVARVNSLKARGESIWYAFPFRGVVSLLMV